MDATGIVKRAAAGRDQAHAQALRLLQLEGGIRSAASPSELVHHMANESRAVLGFRQAFVLRRRRGHLRVETISSISVVERNAPLVRWVEALAKRLSRDAGTTPVPLTAAEVEAPDDYPFAHLLWLPMVSKDGTVFGAILLAAEKPWDDKRIVLAERLGGTYGHAWQALTKGRVAVRGPAPSRVALAVLLIAAACLYFIKIPITAIAPVEVVGRDALVVSAPLDGVMAEVVVRPNQPVAAGTLLGRIEDTELRNAAEIARQSVNVARSRVASLSASAFADPNARRDIAIAEAEAELAEAELDLALERLSRTELRAPASGIVVLDDSAGWRGRPVSTGERVLEIADPARIEYEIALPVDDLIALDGSRPARIFLDSAPLDPRRAEIAEASHQAVAQSDGGYAFELRARDQSEDGAPPRIGARGTAQVLGQDARLGFVIFRRPLSWIRQSFGI